MDKAIKDSIQVKGNISDIYKFWEDFENFPKFMQNIKSISKTGSKTSHWVMDGPMGRNIEWDAIITEQVENKVIAWKSTEGDVNTFGRVTFNAIKDDVTEVTVQIHYEPPAGILGEGVARLFGDPEKKLHEDLVNFRKYAENAGFAPPE